MPHPVASTLTAGIVGPMAAPDPIASRVARTSRLRDLLRERILVMDGAMGTMIQTYQLDEAAFRGDRFGDHPTELRGANDLLVLTQPDIIRSIHAGYLAAGADCAYPILCPVGMIADLVRRIDGPINVLAAEGVPAPVDLQALGVARMTWGGGLAAAAYAEAARIVAAGLLWRRRT